MSSKAVRAKQGGQVGVNGQRYEGGQFLPSDPLADKGITVRRPNADVAPAVRSAKPLPENFDALILELAEALAGSGTPAMHSPGGHFFNVSWLDRNDVAQTLTERSRAAIRASRLLRWCDQNLVNEEAKRVIRERDE